MNGKTDGKPAMTRSWFTKESLSPDWRIFAPVLGLVRKTLGDSPLWRARERKTGAAL